MNFLTHIKKHWFPYTSILLIISMITMFCCIVGVLEKAAEKTMLEKDILTMQQLNEDMPKEYFEYQLTTLYNFYNELGYDLNNYQLYNTRTQFLEHIQNEIDRMNIYSDFLELNNIDSESKKILKENLKISKTPSEIYDTYVLHIKDLSSECMVYILENKLIDIEEEKRLLKEEYPSANDNFINTILTEKIHEKTLGIITNTLLEK